MTDINNDKVWNINVKPNTIFVSIASFRDDECNLTIKRLYEKAKYPTNVFVGLCQQNNYELDNDSLYDIHNNNNIKTIRIPYYEAKGPTYARFLCSSLYNGEEFYFQIDSHTKFIQDWDVICINMIREIKQLGLSQKPVLSHYPKAFEEYDDETDENKKLTPVIVKAIFNEQNNIVSMDGAENMDLKGFYNKSPFLASGMMFCESYFLNELPYNPRLDYLYVGEEISHAIRYYTHGWDIYTPKTNVAYHEYTREGKPKIWTDIVYDDKYSEKRIKVFLKLIDDDLSDDNNYKHDLKYYGMGTVRTLEEFYDFAGVDIINKRITKNFKDYIIKSEIKEEIIEDDERKQMSECMIKLLKKIINKLDDKKKLKKDKSINLLLKLLDKK